MHKNGFHRRLWKTVEENDQNNMPIDTLSIIPNSWVEKESNGDKESRLGKLYEKFGKKVWDGTKVKTLSNEDWSKGWFLTTYRPSTI